MNEAKNQINDSEHTEAKINQNNKKEKEYKKRRIVKLPLGLQAFQHSHHRGAKEKRKCKKLEIYLKK